MSQAGRAPPGRLPRMRVGALVSGSGTILDAMLDASIPVDVVVLDRPCGAADVAARHGVPVALIQRSTFDVGFDRDAYTVDLTKALVDHGIDLVVMAGFGTILGEAIYERYSGHVLNTHPALLPSFPGWHGVRDALEHGVKVTGCTVHVATLEVDAGPILAQEAVMVHDDDTEATLHERIKVVERRLYVQTVKTILGRGHVLEPTDPQTLET
jgi:phosphoribosylglycinamide formyltransferase-1